MINYNELSREELIARINQLEIDSAFGILNRNGAMARYSTIESGKSLIMVDIANMHAANHKFTMNGVDTLIRNVVKEFRHDDLVIRFGGDELVILLNSGNAEEYVKRFDAAMKQNHLYAVYAIVTTSNSLLESVVRADALVSEVKYALELNGMKPDRSAEYKVLESHIISE